jgi:hypothetical protein
LEVFKLYFFYLAASSTPIIINVQEKDDKSQIDNLGKSMRAEAQLVSGQTLEQSWDKIPHQLANETLEDIQGNIEKLRLKVKLQETLDLCVHLQRQVQGQPASDQTSNVAASETFLQQRRESKDEETRPVKQYWSFHLEVWRPEVYKKES